MAELIIPFQKLVLSNLNLTLHLDFKINLLIIMLNLISLQQILRLVQVILMVLLSVLIYSCYWVSSFSAFFSVFYLKSFLHPFPSILQFGVIPIN